MKLNRVEIKNFRSIENQKVIFDNNCRILVGVNESGKSNVLKALKLLGDEDINPTDIRLGLDEEKIEESYVWFIFSLEEIDKKVIAANTMKGILAKPSTKIVSDGKQELSIPELINLQSEGIFCVDLIKSKKYASYWATKDYVLLKDWKKPNLKAIPSITVQNLAGVNVPLNSFSMLGPSVIIKDSAVDIVENISLKDITSMIGKEICNLVNDELPKTVYWNYDDKYLLPARVSISSFMANPEICVPLKNMFELANKENISTEISNAIARPPEIRNLLDKVARATTKHVRSIWKEYKTFSILLEPDGDFIDASVIEKTNRFSFTSRSDGFKRFISFLLIISAKVKTNELKNTLILIDEPEISLHPTGARYLLEELLKISDNNHVLFSTHSIFMIDRENVSRHILVSKEGEKTTLTNVNTSNFQDEEVIYNALGHSVFETLKEKNILFEGWKDKKIFQTAMSKLPAKHKSLKAKFENIGIAHLQGVRDAGRIGTILDLANRKYIILSDDDEPAKEAQKIFSGTNGMWKRYGELLSSVICVTGEDFIKCSLIQNAVSEQRKIHPTLTAISDEDLNADDGKINAIKRWLHKCKVDKEGAKDITLKIKNYVADNMKVSDIEDHYYTLLSKIEIT